MLLLAVAKNEEARSPPPRAPQGIEIRCGTYDIANGKLDQESIRNRLRLTNGRMRDRGVVILLSVSGGEACVALRSAELANDGLIRRRCDALTSLAPFRG